MAPDHVRPSLLRNNGDGTFTDVTEKAGLLAPLNSDTVAWADYDNDGFVDLFVGGERQPCRLYRNKGDGTFEEVAARAGLAAGPRHAGRAATGSTSTTTLPRPVPDQLLRPRQALPQQPQRHLHRREPPAGDRRPEQALSCWAWDYDNDGCLDIFAPHYDRVREGTIEHVVKGLAAASRTTRATTALYRNLGGKGFQDVTKEVGLDVSSRRWG